MSALDEARRLHEAGQGARALDELGRLAAAPPQFATWMAADVLRSRLQAAGATTSWARRRVRLAVLSSHTAGHLAAGVRVAALAHGIELTTVEAGFRSYEQQVADPASDLYRFLPDVVLLVVDHAELRLPALSEEPEADLAAEVARWTGLWALLRERSTAVVVQATFVPPVDDALGDVGASMRGGRRALVRALNAALQSAAPAGVHLVDAEAVAGEAGLRTWFDPRYRFASGHAVGPGAVGLLAQRAMDVTAAALGLSRKVVVLDLDNTLWGGVIGEDGIGGILLGGAGPGRAFVEFQHFVGSLRHRGIVLAVASKNNPQEARLPFAEHPEMVLALDDFVAFEASWDDKPTALRRIAESIGVGLDALVFVDDNPAERERVRAELPEVAVVEMPDEPSGHVAALATFPGLQSAGLTSEDARRTQQYRARRAAADLASSARSKEEFLAGLEMSATVEELAPTNAVRIVQLINKTNQLNLNGRRRTASEVEAVGAEPDAVVWGLRVRDRFDDHGLVAALIAEPEGDALRVTTFVASCRVLGRTVEHELLAALVRHALASGRSRVLAEFVPTGRNEPAARLLPEVGFVRVGPQGTTGDAQGEQWELVGGRDVVVSPGFVAMTPPTLSAMV